jgi:hypothetical protein
MAILVFAWVLAILAQLPEIPVVSAAIGLAFTPPAPHFLCIFAAILLFVISRHMYRWRRHRLRPKRQKPPSILSAFTSRCAQASLFVTRTIFLAWLCLMCTGIFLRHTSSSLGLCTLEHALHSDIDVAALHSLHAASPATRQLPNMDMQPRFAAFAKFMHSHFIAQSSHASDRDFQHFYTNATSSASSLLSSSASHLQSFQPWSAAAHRLVPSASAFHASAQNTTSSSSDTATHMDVAPQGPQSAYCSHPTYAFVSATLPGPTNVLPPSLSFYRLPSRGGRQLALQRFGAAAGGVMQLAWRIASRLSSWGGGVRITLAAAGDIAGRLGVAAQQLWRHVSAHCTAAPRHMHAFTWGRLCRTIE